MDYTAHKYIRLAQFLKDQDLYPYFRPINESNASHITVKGKSLVMIGSNNYLGLTHHPYVKQKAMDAIAQYGTGCTGSRFLNGNFTIHEELEERLAKFIGHEDCLIYATGMQVNLGSISALLGPRDLCLADAENHASIVDGLRMAQGTTLKYKHNNMQELEELLAANAQRFENTLIVTDGVFSMTGRLADIKNIHRLAKQYQASVYVDDAHGVGVLGKHGRGTLEYFDLTDGIDFNMGTFSKSFASVGGFITGSKPAINYLRHLSRTFMFSAAPPPSTVGTVMGCLDLLESTPEILNNLWKNVALMKQGLDSLGFNTMGSCTPIIPILIGDELKAMKITRYLFEHGVFATPVMPPATPPNMALIRTSYSAAHTTSELEYCLDIFARVAKKFELRLNHEHEHRPLGPFQQNQNQEF